LGGQVMPGTDQGHSIVNVPILGSDRVLGSIILTNHERESAFGEAEVRLLSTVAASMGVALQSARLRDETQRLFKESEQANSATARNTRSPLLLCTTAEYRQAGIITLPGTDTSKSLMSVPIISSDRVLGGIQIENYERDNAYGESDVRLLTTIAGSLGTALENARLFDETQRLLKETEQRNAELAIINSVQAALAAELNIQGINEAVGDQIREIFHNRDMGIRVYDPKTNL